MPGELLTQTPFIDLLPDSISSDPKIAAAAATLDAMLMIGDLEQGNVLIWSRIDAAEEPLLTNLSVQLHLEGYEGWQMAETLEQKRQLVKEAVILHFYKGTRFTLERLFEILETTGRLIEWWQAPEDATFKPYEFDMDVEADRPLPETFYYDVLQLIDALKNLRSHRRRTRIVTTSQGETPYLAPVTLVGVTVEVYPDGGACGQP